MVYTSQAELTVANAKGVFPSSHVLVTLAVLDRNDNSPAFGQSTYAATLSDCDLPGSLLAMHSLITVTDLDQVGFIAGQAGSRRGSRRAMLRTYA